MRKSKVIIYAFVLGAILAVSAGCSTIDEAVMNMRDKAVSDQMVVDGVYVTTMNPTEAKATPEVKAGHVQRDYTGVPVMKGQPIQIIKRNYSLFFGQLISEFQVTVTAPSDGVIKFHNDLLKLETAKPVKTIDKVKP